VCERYLVLCVPGQTGGLWDCLGSAPITWPAAGVWRRAKLVSRHLALLGHFMALALRWKVGAGGGDLYRVVSAVKSMEWAPSQTRVSIMLTQHVHNVDNLSREALRQPC
jgi:hypothetical protein